MELKVVEETKRKLILQVNGIGHAFCNALIDQLWANEKVDVASYAIRHPLIGVPEIIVEVKSGEDAKKVLIDAAKHLEKSNEKLKKQFMEELR
ncbi:DNA-directed RNA polymerase subunit L [Candidatus Woesearchaeota archaeon]|nr:DNA-directed RNA polymerase subunit L [Candidatus Woesearchaeota archaeon]